MCNSTPQSIWICSYIVDLQYGFRSASAVGEKVISI